jgi:hypothetical protein
MPPTHPVQPSLLRHAAVAATAATSRYLPPISPTLLRHPHRSGGRKFGNLACPASKIKRHKTNLEEIPVQNSAFFLLPSEESTSSNLNKKIGFFKDRIGLHLKHDASQQTYNIQVKVREKIGQLGKKVITLERKTCREYIFLLNHI